MTALQRNKFLLAFTREPYAQGARRAGISQPAGRSVASVSQTLGQSAGLNAGSSCEPRLHCVQPSYRTDRGS